jgi:hypothetical protein
MPDFDLPPEGKRGQGGASLKERRPSPAFGTRRKTPAEGG